MLEPIKLTPAQRGRMYGLIRRLESGKYKQGKGSLRITKGKTVFNCCLGVACTMLVESKKLYWGKPRKNTGTYPENNGSTLQPAVIVGMDESGFNDSDIESQSIIPRQLENLFGFDDRSTDERQWQSTYWKMNDERRKSFPEIAAELRRNFGFRRQA